jgi:hypothetical protein
MGVVEGQNSRQRGKGLEMGAASWVMVQFDAAAALRGHLARQTRRYNTGLCNAGRLGKCLGKCCRKHKKDTKIEGTNPTSPLESTKVPKNKPKTNWFLHAKRPKQNQKWCKKRLFFGLLRLSDAASPVPAQLEDSVPNEEE